MKSVLPVLLALSLGLSACMSPEQQAAKQAEANRPQLGVDFQPEWLTENTVVVRSVWPGSPAEKAGLLSGDTIVGYAGQKVTTVRSLKDLQLKTAPGSTVQLNVLRVSQPIIMNVQL